MVGMITAIEHIEHIARMAQGLGDPLGQFAMIFDKQQAHGSESESKAG